MAVACLSDGAGGELDLEWAPSRRRHCAACWGGGREALSGHSERGRRVAAPALCEQPLATDQRLLLSGDLSNIGCRQLDCSKQCGGVATEDDPMLERINPDARWSDAVVVGNLIFVAGHTAEKTRGQSVREQTEEVLQLLDDTLAQAGVTKRNLAMVRSIWLTCRTSTR